MAGCEVVLTKLLCITYEQSLLKIACRKLWELCKMWAWKLKWQDNVSLTTIAKLCSSERSNVLVAIISFLLHSASSKCDKKNSEIYIIIVNYNDYCVLQKLQSKLSWYWKVKWENNKDKWFSILFYIFFVVFASTPAAKIRRSLRKEAEKFVNFRYFDVKKISLSGIKCCWLIQEVCRLFGYSKSSLIYSCHQQFAAKFLHLLPFYLFSDIFQTRKEENWKKNYSINPQQLRFYMSWLSEFFFLH